ncbi:MAG: tRNA (adenosine(37)-N6)-threonylcarbamoyltransferase complex dimerization subunit type 1 TsaB [Proteobacteria bacterium]|nr:tRNA (adenosine(37)-N6)-threonylcarbamoyltransferase complex dimerization subunit type 1 TsaB [Pseudomonadota bacterium]
MIENILAIETGSQACSVAIITPVQHYTRLVKTQKEHTQLLLPMVRDLLAQASLSLTDLHAIAVGRGPGSFTGVRIAISAAQGLAYGLSLPVYPVSTLEALCMSAFKEELPAKTVVVPALDARMQEIYAAAYILEDNRYAPVLEEQLIAPQFLLNKLEAHSLIALGSGWDVYFNEIVAGTTKQIKLKEGCCPEALHIGFIAQKQIQSGIKGLAAKSVLPVYLRDNVAQKPLNIK